MFVAEFNDVTHHLRFVNCGHNPPIVIRRGGCVQRLQATAGVLGAFPQWHCEVEEIVLETGDLLALFTDGISEAANDDDEEFGEDRLIAVFRQNQGRTATETLEAVTHRVQEFAGREHFDDLTLIIARVVDGQSMQSLVDVTL